MSKTTTHPKCTWKTFTVEYSVEIAQDLQAIYGLDMEKELNKIIEYEVEAMFNEWVKSPEGKAEILDRIENGQEALEKFLARANHDNVDFSTEFGFLKQVAALNPERGLTQNVFVMLHVINDPPVDERFKAMSFVIEKLPVTLKGNTVAS